MCGGGGGNTGFTEDQEEQANRTAREAKQRQDALVSEQTSEAKQFRTNMPDMQNQLDQNLVDTSRRNLASQIYGNKVDSSNRGILNSRLSQANEGQIRGESAANLASAKSGVASGLINQANDYDAQAAAGQLQDFSTRQNMEDQIYNRALTAVMQKTQLNSQIGQSFGPNGSGGSAAGAMAAL